MKSLWSVVLPQGLVSGILSEGLGSFFSGIPFLWIFSINGLNRLKCYVTLSDEKKKKKKMMRDLVLNKNADTLNKSITFDY